ncbi:MAG: glycosyl transferase group 1 [Firmicutes bacterium]|nr:glycosyl transferase group 1 [Bacillota bacterium]
MIRHIRIGIPILGSSHWYAGVSTVEWLVKAIQHLPEEKRPQLFLVITDRTLKDFSMHQGFASLFNGIIFQGGNLKAARTIINFPLTHCVSLDQLFNKIDFLFPVNSQIWPGRFVVSWIPDFQHRYMPDFISPQEYALREHRFGEIARQAQLIIFTTRTVEKDFLKFYPSSTAITKILSAPFYPEEDWYISDSRKVQHHYQLPDGFILCSNQFWLHKNHATLFKAIAILRHIGIDVPLVCTGFTEDYRCPDYFSQLQDYLKTIGITDLVHILGLIPRSEQIQLIRRSLFVVQPSLFEGLSMIVQECQAFNKTIILSDLDVHLEQGYGIFFDRMNPEELAQKIADILPYSAPGPHVLDEAEAKNKTFGKIKLFAEEFCNFAQEALAIFKQK